jgi:hypothetical protein
MVVDVRKGGSPCKGVGSGLDRIKMQETPYEPGLHFVAAELPDVDRKSGN